MFSSHLAERFQNILLHFYYDLDLLNRSLQLIQNEANKYNFHIHYAVKANANPKILHLIQAMVLVPIALVKRNHTIERGKTFLPIKLCMQELENLIKKSLQPYSKIFSVSIVNPFPKWKS